MRATELAHLIMRQTVGPGDLVVDATVGNGHDTLFLAECVGPSGLVLGFDVQEAALTETARHAASLPQVQLVLAGHQELSKQLATIGTAKGQTRPAGVMFNLGYLPGASKTIKTHTETTLAGLEQATTHLRADGVVTLVCYPGHPGGVEETAAVRSYAQALPSAFAVSRYHRANASQPAPELVLIKRLGEINA